MSLIKALSRGRRAEIQVSAPLLTPASACRLPAPAQKPGPARSRLLASGRPPLSAGTRPSRRPLQPSKLGVSSTQRETCPQEGAEWQPPDQLGKKGVFVGAEGLSLPSAFVRSFLSRAVPVFPSRPFREKPRPCVRHPHPPSCTPAPPGGSSRLARLASAGAAPPQEETRVPLASVSGIPDCWKRRQGTDYLPNRET